MLGWSENEIRNKNLMAPCGLYCGVCGVYIATRDNNNKFKAIMGHLYGTELEETECMGCMQPDGGGKLFAFCRICSIRDCVKSKGFYACHQCHDWPCDPIENFGIPMARQIMKCEIPVWRSKVERMGAEKGSQAWALGLCERYHCDACGHPLFRGARRCRTCKHPVPEDLDGTV